MEKICSIKTNIDQANDMFAVINRYFYDNRLSVPVINISVLGTRVRHSRYIPAVWNDVNHQAQAEIIIDGNITRLGNAKSVFKELLYCAVMHYCFENKVKCSSGSGNTYLNKRFYDIASKHGLICAKTKPYGYKVTGINDESKNLVDKYGWCFLIEREKYTYGKKFGNNGSSSIKYFCPVCGNSVRATKTVRISCLDCNKEMITGFDTQESAPV